MYKIYVNDRPLYLIKTEELSLIQKEYKSPLLALMWMPRARTIFNCVDQLMKSSQEGIILYGADPKTMWQHLKSLYTHVRACGGLVYDEGSSNILMIFRRGYWDLPKGKMDPGETKRQTAVREVEEETGLHQIKLHHKICKSYHLFVSPKGKKVVKTTHWYRMTATDINVTPQTEEDIEKVEWMKMEEAQALRPIYPNILDVLHMA